MARCLRAGGRRFCHRSFCGGELLRDHQGITALHSSTRDTSVSDCTCTPIQVSYTHRNSLWALEGMVVTGKFRRPPDQSCSCFTASKSHINNECAKRRSVCIVLLLLVRDLCLKLGAVMLTEDFNKGAERELPPGGTDDLRCISSLDVPLASPPFLGLLLASRRCGALAASPSATSGQSVAESLCCQKRKTSGSSCVMILSTLSLLPSA